MIQSFFENIVTICEEILGEDGYDDRVIGARLTPFEGFVTNGEIRNGGWMDGGATMAERLMGGKICITHV